MCFLKFAMEDGTILTDDVHKLYVFQVHKGQDLSAEDYLENPYKFDKENKTVDKKDLKSMTSLSCFNQYRTLNVFFSV